MNILYFYVKLLKIYYIFLSIFIINRDKRHSFKLKNIAKIKTIYLKEYLYAIKNLKYKKDDNIRSKIIWVCWLQGIKNAPEIVKKCIESIQKFYKDEYEIVVVDKENMYKYIYEKFGTNGNIPDYVFEKYKKGLITNIQFSDILRLCLLSKYGGIWIDATVFLTDKIPSEIINSNFFAFHSKHQYISNSWLLVANKNDLIINSMRRLMLEYWKHENKMIDYFLYHLFFSILIQNDKKCREEWEKVPIFYCSDCYDLVSIMINQFDEKKFNEIKQKTSINKLTYKYNTNINTSGTYLEKILNSEI